MNKRIVIFDNPKISVKYKMDDDYELSTVFKNIQSGVLYSLPIIIAFLFFLDYDLFTDYFKFSKADFREFYIANFEIFTSYTFILILLIPLFFVIVHYSIVALVIFSASTIYSFDNKINQAKFFNTLPFWTAYITVLSIEYCFQEKILSLLTNQGESIIIFSLYLLLLIPLLVAYLVLFFVFNFYKIKINNLKEILTNTFFAFIVLEIIIICSSKNSDCSLLVLLVIFQVFSVGFSFQYLDLLNKEKILKEKKHDQKSLYFLITFLIVILMIAFYQLSEFNKRKWNESNNEKESFNLFLNKAFFAKNVLKLEVSINEGYKKILEDNNLSQLISKSNELLINPYSKDLNVMYLPLSEDRKIFQIKDKNFSINFIIKNYVLTNGNEKYIVESVSKIIQR